MKKSGFTLVEIMIVVAIMMLATFVQAEEWKVDKVHSWVGFEVSHLVVSKVKGRFNHRQMLESYARCKNRLQSTSDFQNMAMGIAKNFIL